MSIKNALKGALLSGLVLPGLGQLAQKRYRAAAALLLSSLVGLVVMIMVAVRQVRAVLDRLAAAGGHADLKSISAAAARVAPGAERWLFDASLLLMMGVWVVGVFDAIRGGRRMDRQVEK